VGLALISALAHQARLFFALLPALALLGAAGVAGARGLNTPSLRLSAIVNAVVGLALALSGIELLVGFAAQDPLPAAVGAQSAADYRTAKLGWYVPVLAKVNGLPAGSRVVFLWEARAWGCAATIECVPDVIIDRWWHARRLGEGAEQVMARWRSEGVTHVLLYEAGARLIEAEAENGYEPGDWVALEALRGALEPVVAFGEAYTLYALP
jgi:hypothetical protein